MNEIKLEILETCKINFFNHDITELSILFQAGNIVSFYWSKVASELWMIDVFMMIIKEYKIFNSRNPREQDEKKKENA